MIMELIGIHPVSALFKVYHYKKQYDTEKRLTEKQLSKIYLGVIYQSNWAARSKFWCFSKKKNQNMTALKSLEYYIISLGNLMGLMFNPYGHNHPLA